MSSPNIYPKSCVYNCNTQIYWNNSTNEYWEVFTKKKHLCPNRQQQQQQQQQSKPTISTTTTTRPNYYNKFTKQPKPKMSNSLELLSGSIDSVQKRYEILSDIVIEYNGKVHGSQSHMLVDNLLALVVYYEVPEGKREEVKQKFNNFIRNIELKISSKM